MRSDEPGRTYILTVNKIGSLRTGSPVLFRDATVGEVLGYDLGNGLEPVKVSIFVRAPFDDLVRPESRFWNSSGITLNVQPGQFHVEFESLTAILSGAIDFSLPQQARDSPPSKNNASFPLYGSKQDADNAGYAQLIPAVTYFHSSVSGLKAGSPVEIFGIQVGVVTSVTLLLDPVKGDEVVRVAMTLQPERNMHQADFATSAQTDVLMQKFVDRGMRAELETSSFVTGQKDISFAIIPHAKPVKLTREGDAYVLPSQSSDLDSTLASLSDIASKIDKMPFEQIGINLNTLLKTTNNTIGGKQTKQAIASLNQSLNSLDGTLTMLNEDYGNDSDFQHDLAATDATGQPGFGVDQGAFGLSGPASKRLAAGTGSATMILARRRLVQIATGLAGAAALQGCRSAPPAEYFRLAPVPGATLQTAPASVQIREIGVPEYLQQNGIAEPSSQYQFAASANDLWAEPLGQMLQSTLVQDLTQRLPQMTVTASSGMVGTPADLLVEINLLRFDPDASGRIVLTAQAAVKDAKDNRFVATRTLQSERTPTGADMPSAMQAMSALWAGLADALAQMLAQAGT